MGALFGGQEESSVNKLDQLETIYSDASPVATPADFVSVLISFWELLGRSLPLVGSKSRFKAILRRLCRWHNHPGQELTRSAMRRALLARPLVQLLPSAVVTELKDRENKALNSDNSDFKISIPGIASFFGVDDDAAAPEPAAEDNSMDDMVKIDRALKVISRAGPLV